MKTALTAALLLVASVAIADEEVKIDSSAVRVEGHHAATESRADYGQHWSLVGPRTIRSGMMFQGRLGFPGLDLSLWGGLSSRVDIGGRFTFNYSQEGALPTVIPGIKAQFLLKTLFFDNGRFNVGMWFGPGMASYFTRFYSSVGFTMPFGVMVGISPSSAFTIGITLDLLFTVLIRTNSTGIDFTVPILTGVGLEYFLTSSLVLSFQLKFGPAIRGTGGANLAMEAMMGIGYRF